MSALPPKADMSIAEIDVRFVPLADMGWEKRRASPPSGGCQRGKALSAVSATR